MDNMSKLTLRSVVEEIAQEEGKAEHVVAVSDGHIVIGNSPVPQLPKDTKNQLKKLEKIPVIEALEVEQNDRN